MRIGICGTELCGVGPRGGGLEKLLHGWAGALSSSDEVTIFTLAPPRFSNLSIQTQQEPAFVELTSPYQLDEAGREKSLDVMVINNRPSWSHLLSIPTLVLFHNYENAWYDRQVGYIGPPWSSHVGFAAVSRPLSRFAQKALSLDAQPSLVTPFVTSHFLEGLQSSLPDHPRLLFPNRLMKKKGVAELLAAMVRLEAECPPIDFTYNLSPADLPDEEHLSLAAQITAIPQARLISPAESPAQVAALYSAYSAVLVPSVEPEGFGLVPLEALSLGVAVVGSSLGGLSEISGYFINCIDPLNTQDFADALRLAAQATRLDPSVRNEIASHYSLGHSTSMLREAIIATMSNSL